MKFTCSECKLEVYSDDFPGGWISVEIVDTCPRCGNQEEYDYDFCCEDHRNSFISLVWPEYKEEN